MVKPIVRSVEPSRVSLGEQLDIVIQGEGFDKNAEVEVKGPARIEHIAFVSSTELRGRLVFADASAYKHPERIGIIVRNPGHCYAEDTLEGAIEIVSAAARCQPEPAVATISNSTRQTSQRIGMRMASDPMLGEQVALIASGGYRVEATLLDESQHGLSVLLPDVSGLRLRQRVRIIFRRERMMGEIRRIEDAEGGKRVGLRLIGS